jgi:glycosyltransferase involved in cell wall biosynthesis
VLPWSIRHTGGVNQVVSSLIKCFLEHGIFSPQLLITSDEESSDIIEPGLITPHHLDIWSPVDDQHPIRSVTSFIYNLPRRCWVLRRMITQGRIQVINPHYPGLGCLLFVILKKLRLFRGMIILSFHLSDIRSASRTAGLERRLWKLVLRAADHVVVVSNDLGKDVLALESTAAGKITTVYNGVDLSLFGRADGELRTKSFDPDQGKSVVSVGAFLQRKGHEVLVRAFARVVKKIPDVRLIIIGGDGPEAEPLQNLIKTASLTDRVFLIKNVPHEQVPTYLFRANLFVLASREEGNPLAVIEAGAAGLPVIFTRKAGSRELINDGVTGRLVDVDDECALADAIIDLLEHPEEAQQMAANFYEYIKNNLSWEKTYAQYLRLATEMRE